MSPRLARSLASALVAVPLVTGVASCGGSADQPPGPAGTSAPTRAPSTDSGEPPFDVRRGKQVPPREFVDTISRARAEAGTYTVHTISSMPGVHTESTSIMDVSDPDNPKAHVVQDTPGASTELLLVDRTVYTRALSRGSGSPTDPPENGASPEPEGPWTAVAVDDLDPEASLAIVQIYDARGRDNALAGAIESVTYEGEEEFEASPVFRYTVAIDQVKLVRGLASVAGITRSRPEPTTDAPVQEEEYRLFSDGRVHTTSADTPGSSVRTVITDYGADVTITAPPTEQVVHNP